MIDFIDTLLEYCDKTGLKYTERIGDCGTLVTATGKPEIVKDGGYYAEILRDGKSVAMGFSRINPEEETATADFARKSLLFALLSKATL